MENNIEKITEELIKAIHESEVYVNFEEHKRIAKKDPELTRNIKRTRVIREQLSKMSDFERESQSGEALEREYDDLLDVTAIHRFSIAEHKLCSMYQEIVGKIISNIDIDI